MNARWLPLASYVRPHLTKLAVALLLLLFTALLAALTPWPLKLIIDYVLPGKALPEGFAWIGLLPGGGSQTGLVALLVSTTVALFLVQQLTAILQNYLQSGAGTRMVYSLSADLFDHLQRLSFRAAGRRKTGDLLRRLTTDAGCVRDLLIGILFPVAHSVVNLAIMFAVMWRVDSSLSLVALLAVLPLPFLMRLFAPLMMQRSYEHQNLEGRMMAFAEQNLTALPIIQAFGGEPREDARFRGLSESTLRRYLEALRWQLRFKFAIDTPLAIGTASLLALGGLHVLRGSLSLGGLLVFLAYLNSMYEPIAALAYLSSGFAASAASARRVLEILEDRDSVQEMPEAVPLERLPATGRSIRFENVTFGYDSSVSVLKTISLEIQPGETVALVGPTGSGKTTLVSLIPRFFDPSEGRVLLNGTDLRRIRLSSLRSEISLMLQEPFLLPLTVAENIAYGKPDAGRTEIISAAAAAHADEFISRLPESYDTVLGERGMTLSAGEKQRIAIARAFLRNAPILILDEPTSHLDARTEALVLEALERLMSGRTTIMIAHRLSTIRRADRIVVLERGRLVESGTHQELLDNGKVYARFHAILHERWTTSA